MKRIAIATADGVSVCDHLARSAAFIVVEIMEGRETSRSVRSRGTEACGNHGSFVQMLSGCEAVICGGIGEGAVGPLAAHGVTAFVSPASAGKPVDEVLQAWLEGRLVTSNERICLCSH